MCLRSGVCDGAERGGGGGGGGSEVTNHQSRLHADNVMPCGYREECQKVMN